MTEWPRKSTVTAFKLASLIKRGRKHGYHNQKGKTQMSELEKQIANRVENNADMEGAQDLIDAHIDAVTGGRIIIYHISFTKVIEQF